MSCWGSFLSWNWIPGLGCLLQLSVLERDRYFQEAYFNVKTLTLSLRTVKNLYPNLQKTPLLSKMPAYESDLEILTIGFLGTNSSCTHFSFCNMKFECKFLCNTLSLYVSLIFSRSFSSLNILLLSTILKIRVIGFFVV